MKFWFWYGSSNNNKNNPFEIGNNNNNNNKPSATITFPPKTNWNVWREVSTLQWVHFFHHPTTEHGKAVCTWDGNLPRNNNGLRSRRVHMPQSVPYVQLHSSPTAAIALAFPGAQWSVATILGATCLGDRVWTTTDCQKTDLCCWLASDFYVVLSESVYLNDGNLRPCKES